MKLLFITVVLLLSTLLSGVHSVNYKAPTNVSTEKIKGLCWVAGDSISTRNIEPVCVVGATWISQTPFGWMQSYDDPEIKLITDRVLWGERDVGLTHTHSLLNREGIKTMLKPHIWLSPRTGKWRSDIQMKSRADWDLWFKNYELFILHYAKLAENQQIEALCIGTELHQTTRQYPEEWRKIIKKIRKVYGGKLTYAANWYQEFEEVTFWDDLDYIGVQAYFPLTKKRHPSKKELVRSWKKPLSRLKRLSQRYQKPVIFTEIGYKNTPDSAKEPWTWPQFIKENELEVCDETQKVCYEALFESVWNEPWFGGMFIWKWFHSTYRHDNLQDYFEEREKRYRRRLGNNQNRIKVFFSPQIGPALEVLQYYYHL